MVEEIEIEKSTLKREGPWYSCPYPGCNAKRPNLRDLKLHHITKHKIKLVIFTVKKD